MRDLQVRWDRHVCEIRPAGWPYNGRAFGLDDEGRDREMPGLGTRQSDDPVLRIRRLLKEKLSALGPYHRAVIIPNQGGS
jgi:hypothetical protein